MKILTIIAATLYAVLLWFLAPKSIWDCEVKKAKMNRNKPTLETPQKQLETPKTPQDSQTTETLLETPKTPHTATETTETPQATNWTVAKLRKIAQTRQIKWKDNNGKPLKKLQLMEVLKIE